MDSIVEVPYIGNCETMKKYILRDSKEINDSFELHTNKCIIVLQSPRFNIYKEVCDMDINSITYVGQTAYAATNKQEEKKEVVKEETTNKDTAVVYEKTTRETDSVKKTYTKEPDTELIQKLKADADARLSQLKSLVEQLITKQSSAFFIADMSEEEFWNKIREGNFEVDEATRKQAQEDISEDGYWGVKQTSERMLSFAKALTGGDPAKAEEMRAAIQKGFEQAEKLWGGELPEISKQTYDAVMKGIDEWIAGEEQTETEE